MSAATIPQTIALAPLALPAPESRANDSAAPLRAPQGPGIWASRAALASAVALTLLAFGWLLFNVWSADRESADLLEHVIQIEVLRGDVLRLDETLTMSARMAVETGSVAWEDRYRASEPQLQQALQGIAHLAPEVAREFFGITGSAGARLIAMEHRALALTRANRRGEARAILAGEEFARQKALYESGVDHLVSAVPLAWASARRVGEARNISSLVAACVGLISASLMGMAISTGRLRRMAAEALVVEERARANEMNRLALHDPLTALGNRAYFGDRLQQALSRRGREIGSVGVMFIDLDNFKTVNDSAGHAAGDTLLQATAHRLRECLRPADTVARLGGDEFGVLVEDLPNPDHGLFLAERLGEGLRTTLLLRGKTVRVQASIGLAVSSSIGQAAEALLCEADTAMYRSKEAGKGRPVVFEPAMKMDSSITERTP